MELRWRRGVLHCLHYLHCLMQIDDTISGIISIHDFPVSLDP
jgi:hypothetical protein